MKHKKTFVVILLAGIVLAGCSNGTTDLGLSKTTSIGTIELVAKYYTKTQAAGLPHWDEDGNGKGGWWECNTRNPELALSKLVPGGQLKNKTNYEVTVSGITSTPLEHFQFVFTVPDPLSDVLPWTDLSEDYYEDSIQEVAPDTFKVTGTLKTLGILGGYYSDVEEQSKHGILAFTNGFELDPIPDGTTKDDELMATLTNVIVTITEK